jgi:hypothetical protein
MPVEEIIVLACSRKWGGRCVAGISLDTGGWIRPVSQPSRNGLEPYYWRIEGREIKPLDVVHLEHEGKLGDPSQPENVLVAPARWRLVKVIDSTDAAAVLAPYLVEGPVLLGNRGTSMVEEKAMDGVEASLALVHPDAITFRLDPPWEGKGNRRPRAAFDLNGESYDLALTDYLASPKLMRAGLGSHETTALGFTPDADLYLTVSLAEARNGWCTKLIAAVIPLPKGSQ